MAKSNLFVFLCLFLVYDTSLAQTHFSIKNKYLDVAISARGAELKSIKSKGKEYLWQGDSLFWRGQAPIMFPVNVRFKDNQFTYHGKVYEMPYMGLIASSFLVTVKRSSKTAIHFEYIPTDSVLRKHYPFPFHLNIHYQLKGERLICELEVENCGKDTMYYALGAHPGFCLALNDTVSRSDYQLCFGEKPVSFSRTMVQNSLLLHQDSSYFTQERLIFLNDPRIAKTGMFFKSIPTKKIDLCKRNGNTVISLELCDFPHVNLWSPPGYPFVCIEPMVSHHDFIDSPAEISAKAQLLHLAPKKKQSYRYTIYVGENR